MKAEEQLNPAYITIAELRDQNTRLIDMVASVEKRMSASAAEERRVMEEYYRNMIDTMRESHEKEMEKQRKSTDATIKQLSAQIEKLSARLTDMTARMLDAVKKAQSSESKECAARAEHYGDKCEKRSRIGKRHKDDDRTEGKDNYDGTAGSDISSSTGYDTGTPSQKEKDDIDAIALIQKKILRTHPGAEVTVERIDREKAMFYMDEQKLVKLEDYFILPEGGRFLMRKGKIDLNYVRIIVRYPEKYEEFVYENATVRFKDSDDIRTVDTIEGLDRPIKGCIFGSSTLVYILTEKFWYNTPLQQIVRKLRLNGVKMSKSTLGDNVHRAIEYMREKMTKYWESAIFEAKYLMMDETPCLVDEHYRS